MFRHLTAILLLLTIGYCTLDARTLPNPRVAAPKAAANLPGYCTAAHDVGRLSVAISNYATFGNGVLLSQTDCFTGLEVPSCLFPKTSAIEHLFFGSIWVGAVVGTDTLVSVGHDGWQWMKEMYPDPLPGGALRYRSATDPFAPEQFGAISDEDYIAVYRDTFTDEENLYLGTDVIDGRPHVPMHIEITEESYAWSDTIAEDFVIFNCDVKNIGAQLLQHVYVGIHIDGDIYLPPDFDGVDDDLTGFRKVAIPAACSSSSDSLSVAWIADNDGQLGDLQTQASVIGTVLLNTPPGADNFSYHWWYSSTEAALDFGPSLLTNARDFSTGGSGTPEGDRNKYHLMRNGEIDYDQAFTSYIAVNDPSWVTPPAQLIDSLSDGTDTRYLLSFGPIELAPGASASFVFALVGGEAFHHVPGNLANLPSDPQTYLANLDFSDLDRNVLLAYYLYDNPGVDTDTNFTYGSFVVCEGDTIFTSGDGVPDFKPYVPETGCCIGLRGNVNFSAENLVDLSDLSLLVSYLTGAPGTRPTLQCLDEANVNAAGIIDGSDLALLVAYLTNPPSGKPSLPACP